MSAYVVICKILVLAPLFVLSTGVMFSHFGESFWLLRFLASLLALVAGTSAAADLWKMF
jgi:hypothetical protein